MSSFLNPSNSLLCAIFALLIANHHGAHSLLLFSCYHCIHLLLRMQASLILQWWVEMSRESNSSPMRSCWFWYHIRYICWHQYLHPPLHKLPILLWINSQMIFTTFVSFASTHFIVLVVILPCYAANYCESVKSASSIVVLYFTSQLFHEKKWTMGNFNSCCQYFC